MNSALTWHIWSFSVKIWWQDPMLMPTLSATSRTVKQQFPRITAWTLSTWSSPVDVEGRSGLGSSLTRHSALFKMLQPPIALHSARTVLLICLVKQVKCLCKIFTKFAAKFHTHTHTLFFKLFHCHFVTNPTNSLCMCSVQPMQLDD